MDSQIPFFCGDSVDCRTLGSPTSVQKAKENIEKHFVMVGVLEHIEESLAVMECKMPDYFKVVIHNIFGNLITGSIFREFQDYSKNRKSMQTKMTRKIQR